MWFIYPFETGACAYPSSIDAGVNNYGIENKYSQQFTFGMAQSVTVNGNKFDAAPLNSVTVLSKQTAIFNPIEKVTVFLHSKFSNGMIIIDISGKSLEVDLTSKSSVAIHYDQGSGKFVMGELVTAT